MARFIYADKEIAKSTNYKTIKNLFDAGKLNIIYYARENVYHYCIPIDNAKTKELVEKEMQRLYPNSKEI